MHPQRIPRVRHRGHRSRRRACLGYSSDEVLGQKTSLFSSGTHGKSFYWALWHALEREGQWQGEIWGRCKNGEVIPLWQSISSVLDWQGCVKNYISVFYDVSDQKRSAQYIHHLAYYDALTDLPNRQLFSERRNEALDESRRTGKPLFLQFLDLDRFKYVNDTLGHPAGDGLLCEAAKRLTNCLRRTDMAARLGGDEFIILLKDVKGRNDAKRVARRISAALAQPFCVQGHRLEVRTSIGISCFPCDGDDAATLIKNTDLAMYQAKEEGRGKFLFYEAHLTEQANERLFLEGELGQALKRNELSVHYQPQFNLLDERLAGCEALLRWRHATRGMIPTGKIIPIAEDTGLIIQIGEWVLRTACHQAKEWLRSGLGTRTPRALKCC